MTWNIQNHVFLDNTESCYLTTCFSCLKIWYYKRNSIFFLKVFFCLLEADKSYNRLGSLSGYSEIPKARSCSIVQVVRKSTVNFIVRKLVKETEDQIQGLKSALHKKHPSSIQVERESPCWDIITQQYMTISKYSQSIQMSLDIMTEKGTFGIHNKKLRWINYILFLRFWYAALIMCWKLISILFSKSLTRDSSCYCFVINEAIRLWKWKEIYYYQSNG